MKKITLIITLFLFCLVGYSQSSEAYYKAITTEMYTKNENSGKWELYQKNGTTNITIVIERNFLSVQAQKPTIYKIYRDDMKDIDTETLVGARYMAKDLKTDEYCNIDVLKFKTGNLYLISIIVGRINLRYYVEVE